MESIVPYTEFVPGNIKLSKLRTLDNGGKIVYLSYDDKPIVMQIPELNSPYGPSMWNNDGKGPSKYTLDVSLKGYDSRDNVKKFYDVLSKFDAHMIESGLKNSEEWFKKKYTSKDVLEALYTCVVRRSKDDKYPPTFKMTVPYDNNTNEFRCKVFDKNTKEQLNFNDINFKGAKVSALVQCTGVWIAGGKFGTTWKIIQLRVEQTARITEYAFRDIDGDQADDIDENEESDIDEDDVPAPIATSNKEDDFVDSESDDDLEKKPKKKVVAKKK